LRLQFKPFSRLLCVCWLVLGALACQSNPVAVETEPRSTATPLALPTNSPEPQASATPVPTAAPTPSEVAPKEKTIVVLSPAEKIAQLVGDFDNERGEPTLNRTGERYQLYRTDLGVPFQHNDRTYILFGDAWEPPDDPIAFTTDTKPEDGLELEFLQNKDGTYRPIDIPGISLGAFEVPTEGTSINGKMYIYAATDHSTQAVMGRSVVAVSEDDGSTFTYLYDLSTQHFINVSIVETDVSGTSGYPESEGMGLVMFGSGNYRESNVYLAFQPAADIENPDAIRYFTDLDAQGQPQWSTQESDVQALFDQPCVGEFSVTYNPFIDRWILLYNCAFEDSRGINLRTATEPWGPWSAPQILFDPWDDNGYCHFVHVNWEFDNCDTVHDAGRENEWGGEYGPYQFETLAVGDATQTTIYFTMSTWNPYTVVLMKATIGIP
jgi:hypothetical protein